MKTETEKSGRRSEAEWKRTVKMRAKEAGGILTDLLFPRRCPVCDRPVKPFGRDICDACRSALVPVREPRCLKCGKQLADAGAEYCYDCAHRRRAYSGNLNPSVRPGEVCFPRAFCAFCARKESLRDKTGCCCYAEDTKSWKGAPPLWHLLQNICVHCATRDS